MGGGRSRTVYVDRPTQVIREVKVIEYVQDQATKNQLKQTTEQLNSLRVSKEVYEKQYKQSQSKISHLQTQAQNFISEKNALQTTINTTTSQLAQIKKDNQEMMRKQIQSENKLQQMSVKYQAQKKELSSLKDPKLIEQAEKKLFRNFVNNLLTFDMYNTIPKQNGVKYAAVIGQNSAGKSTCYNWIFGCNLQTGFDDTTQEISQVYANETSRIVYFDSPGINQSVSITNAEYLKAFYQIDYVFIVTAVTFKNSKRTIQVMNKINPPKLFLVRTQCDRASDENQFLKAMVKDRQLLESWGIQRQILYISAKMPDNYKDNQRFKRIMKGNE